METKYYRFVVGNQGIYEVVWQLDPKRNHPSRASKPDGAWLPRIGESYPRAISFWTEYGLKKYKDSGLMKWHIDFVKKPVDILVGTNPKKVLYEDKFQIICYPEDITIIETLNPTGF